MNRQGLRPVSGFGVRIAPAVLALLCIGYVVSAQAQGKSTLDGVYSEAQAKRGQEVFDTTCSRCHMSDLSGSADVPSLAGDKFLVFWTDTPVWMLVDRIQKNMPQDNPKTMTFEGSVDVVAYILSKNGYPAGAGELKPDRADLEGISIAKK